MTDNDILDEILDGDFPLPHYDPPQQNDLPNEPEIDKDGRYWIGQNKAVVERHVQPKDPWSYDRWQASLKTGIPEDELPDEPDYMATDAQPFEPGEK